MKFFTLFGSLLVTLYLFSSPPQGYYTTLDGKSTAALKTELHNILMQDTTRFLSYGSGVNRTWRGFYNTDRDTVTNRVLDMYSPTVRFFPVDYIALGYPGFGQELHIEHSVPRSWWGGHEWAAYKDLNHLFPADGSTNLSKGDNPLGVVMGTPTKNNGVSKTGSANYGAYVGNVFEPADEYKGDFARAHFYVATAYQHYINLWNTEKNENIMEANTYPTIKNWALNVLLQWHRHDPVSTKEQTRNNKVFAMQGNRNPFIDHPDLVEYVWGNSVGMPWNTTTKIDEVKSFTLRYEKQFKRFYLENTNENELYFVQIYNVFGVRLNALTIGKNEKIYFEDNLGSLYIILITEIASNHTKSYKIAL